MNPIGICFRTAGREFEPVIVPIKIVSYGQAPVAYGIASEERIYVIASNCVVEIRTATSRDRKSLVRLLKRGRLQKLTLERPGIIAIKLLVFERGWPDQLHRQTFYAARELGLDWYMQTSLPHYLFMTDFVVLAPGTHPYRVVAGTYRASVIAVRRDRNHVVFKFADDGLFDFYLFILQTEALAMQLMSDFQAGTVKMVEVNDQVLAVVISLRSFGTFLYGFEGLPSDEQAKVLAAGFQARAIKNVANLTGYAGTVANTFRCPHYHHPQPLALINGLGWKLQPEEAQ